ncbi:MAG: sulfurtransferase-like selenium metabolism protein YedF [Geobacter sp.]|nr:MAG: sulfurtransferase-like selenium metabolism protein YedF [Geobacter sp.]
MKTIDCRNMACPLPVVTVRRALAEAPGETLQVLLDDGAPRENVARFAANRGFAVTETSVKDGVALVITGDAAPVTAGSGTAVGPTVMLIASDRLGDGPEELGRLLMKNFIITLLELERLPDRILFVNSGVLLATDGSEVVEALEKLGDRGIEILSCGICLDYFHRRNKLRAGEVTNMFSIAESLLTAGSVVRV